MSVDSTIDAIPESVLSGVARAALLELASFSRITVYHAYGDEPGDWSLWIEALADARPGHNGKVHVSDWEEHWPKYYNACIA